MEGCTASREGRAASGEAALAVSSGPAFNRQALLLWLRPLDSYMTARQRRPRTGREHPRRGKRPPSRDPLWRPSSEPPPGQYVAGGPREGRLSDNPPPPATPSSRPALPVAEETVTSSTPGAAERRSLLEDSSETPNAYTSVAHFDIVYRPHHRGHKRAKDCTWELLLSPSSPAPLLLHM